jgi:oxygen-independent coproporphyrinogen-3 oxidase
MAGIYFHIPFCKTRCVYCDFFSSTNTNATEDYVEAMCRELQNRKDYLKGQTVETIYFGGGTPSQLSSKDFDKLFETLYSCYFENPINTFIKKGNDENIASVIANCEERSRKQSSLHQPGLLWVNPRNDGQKCILRHYETQSLEITLEANPDDITGEYLRSIRHLPFNRISLGIQSFNDNELKFLNRRHDAQSAIRAVELCKKQGFKNISIDLMYGLPGQTEEIWKDNILQAIRLDVQHLSAYHLSYEEGTKLHRLLRQGFIRPVDEELSVKMFDILIDLLTEAGFEQYEISNFAQPDYHSKHNSSYWTGHSYLGIGASAHSYNGISRQWNKKVQGAHYLNQEPEIEIIDKKTAYNDFIITRLRTMKGINTDELQALFGEAEKAFCLKKAEKFRNNGTLEFSGNYLRLTRKGIFVSDGIMSELMA